MTCLASILHQLLTPSLAHNLTLRNLEWNSYGMQTKLSQGYHNVKFISLLHNTAFPTKQLSLLFLPSVFGVQNTNALFCW